MVNRRQVREAVVQLIYSTEFEGGEHRPEAREAFWALLLEEKTEALVIAKTKAFLHLASGREIRVETLAKKAPDAQAHLAHLPESEPLRSGLNRLIASERKWLKQLEELQKLTKSAAESDSKRLSPLIDNLLDQDNALSNRRREISQQAEDFPSFHHQLEPVLSACKKLQNLSDRVQLLAHPDGYAQHPAVSHLRPAFQDIEDLKTRSEFIADALRLKQDELDQKISDIVENYNPSRINPVERCILRLGMYEILFDDEVPTAVAINEAMEISKAFGTSESYRFINGMLDKIAKSQESAAKSE